MGLDSPDYYTFSLSGTWHDQAYVIHSIINMAMLSALTIYLTKKYALGRKINILAKKVFSAVYIPHYNACCGVAM